MLFVSTCNVDVQCNLVPPNCKRDSINKSTLYFTDKSIIMCLIFFNYKGLSPTWNLRKLVICVINQIGKTVLLWDKVLLKVFFIVQFWNNKLTLLQPKSQMSVFCLSGAPAPSWEWWVVGGGGGGGKVWTLEKPSGPSGLSLFQFLACDWEYFYFSADGRLVHRRVTPSPFASTLLYTWVKRDTEGSVLVYVFSREYPLFFLCSGVIGWLLCIVWSFVAALVNRYTRTKPTVREKCLAKECKCPRLGLQTVPLNPLSTALSRKPLHLHKGRYSHKNWLGLPKTPTQF